MSLTNRTLGAWRIEAVSDAVRIVVGTGRQKIILARLAPKQISESETHANARLMACAPRLLTALELLIAHGALGGADHPHDICTCVGCGIRRLVQEANGDGQ